MESEVFSFQYSSSEGPIDYKDIKISTQSPRGSIKLTREGQQHKLDAQLQEIKQDLIENPSDTRKCEQMYEKDLFAALNALGCKFQGTEQAREGFLKEYELQNQIRDLTRVLYDDCGGEIWVIAFFRDSKYYFRIECVRTWPGYEY